MLVKPQGHGTHFMLEVFAEYGAIGVMIMLFAGQIVFLQRTLTSKLAEIEGMVIKLIDRWNRSDERAERRHEKSVDELNDVTDQLNFLKGRINGRGQG